jgi:hypothetical protein
MIMPKRRDFLAQLSVAAAAMAVDPDELRASPTASMSAWDTSWLDRLAGGKYRVVFNASDISDGAAMNYASTFLDHFHEVHGTSDKQTRPVIVFRRLGTPMAFNDVMWDRYELGADTKVTDPATKAAAKRNIFWSDGGTPLRALQDRGLISLVCNVATENWGRSIAERMSKPVDEVQRDLRQNLTPGAIMVPSGIYALIRAQNAGCAWMPGT